MLADDRSFILSATPSQPSELRTIFSEKSEGIRRKLENPPVIRTSGWSLKTSNQATFVQGEFIRVQGHRSIGDLYRDGTFIFAARINTNFLAWSDQNSLNIHPLALIELTANFTHFYGLIIEDFRLIPEQILFSIALRNLHLNGQPNVLPAGPVGDRFIWDLYTGQREAPANNWNSADILVSTESLDPEHVAYQLIRELYVWFGLSDEDIPYTKAKGNSWAVDIDQLAGIGRKTR
jgi:hypothetical protein